ncbi:MAG: hypothetical protein KGI90_07045 [Burkholderiales bacterium]|nr:hypothetical protein [Burkholderiales bacterium]
MPDAKTLQRLLPLAHFTGVGCGTPSAVPARPRPAPAARVATPPADHDPEHELHGASPVAAARRREQARCEAILAAGAHDPVLAANLAFTTRVPRDEALALLASGAPAAPAAAHRPRRPTVAPRVASGWDTAFAAVRTQ